MEIAGSLVDLVENAYDVDAPATAWLESIRRRAEKCFRGPMAVQAYTFRVAGNGDFRLLDLASEPEWAEHLRANHAAASPGLIKRLYLGGRPVSSLRSALRPDDGPLYDQIVRLGVGDALGASGVDPTGFGCALHFLEREASRPSRGAQQGLTRIIAHLAAARRLRESLDQTGSKGDAVSGADAVLSADGTVQHAERDARSIESRMALREAVRRMEHARRRTIRADPEEALGLWRAMVDGRWSLLERFESGGRRILVARRNDPASRPSHALSELERKTVALLAVGHSQKLCAYELGRAESTIHAVAASAMTKMGIGSRAALVELHGALVSDHAPRWPPGRGRGRPTHGKDSSMAVLSKCARASRWRRLFLLGPALGMVLALGSCGSDDGTNCAANPTAAGCPPTTTTTTVPPQRPPVVLDSGSGEMPALAGLFRNLATTETGSLEVTVDWTFAANDIDVFIARGNCSFDQFVSNQCAIAASATSTTTKPERARLANQPAGTYTVVIANFGPGDESIAYQVVFTPGTSSSAATLAGGRIAKPLRVLRSRP